jgi:hypothetical protein
MANRSLLCFAHGQDGDWEAICVDLDIGVQGASFAEVQAMLGEAVLEYVDAAKNETPEVQAQLLGRKAPWHVSLRLWIDILISTIFDRQRREQQASFPVACPA